MDDLRDPRELGLDQDEEEYGALTDDEPELTIEERRTLEAAEKIMEKVRRKKGYGTAASPLIPTACRRSPSPPKVSNSHQMMSQPRQVDHNNRVGNDQKKPVDSHDDIPEKTATPSSSTSYFLDQLEQSRQKIKETQKKQKALLASRSYTFRNNQNDFTVYEVDEKDAVSGQQLSKRYMSHSDLKEAFEDIKVLRLNKLFAKITPPNYEEPEYSNWCAVGILCEKAEPQLSNSAKGKNERYVVFKLGDFKYSVDVYIWGSSLVEHYNKLRIGDVLAVLNPSVFSKTAHYRGVSAGGVGNTGKATTFGLSIRHDDCILEIGHSKNFGYCKGKVRATGAQCKNFIDASSFQYCSYHSEQNINKTASSRMEFQGSYRLGAHVKNGIKQSMFLGKADRNGIGKPRIEILNDTSAPKLDYLSRQKGQFTSEKKHKAFFNDGSNQEDDELRKRQKRQKFERDRGIILKELRLREQLSANFKEGSKLKRLEKNDELDPLKVKEQSDLLKVAFSPDTLSNIGFDPTSGAGGKGLLSLGRRRDDEVLTELREITKNKKVDLSLDEEEKRKRLAMRRETMETIKRLKEKDLERAGDTPLPALKTKKETVEKLSEREASDEAEVGLSDASDEELEIEDKSFSKFKKAINKS